MLRYYTHICHIPCGVRLSGNVVISPRFNQCTSCGVRQNFCRRPRPYNDFNRRTPCGVRLHLLWLRNVSATFQSNAPRAGCDSTFTYIFQFFSLFISINAPRMGCNSKTIQSKRVLVSHRMYGFANYVLYTLKHLPTYCIGITF